MTEGYKQPFEQRYKNMIAEPKCEEFLKNIKMPWMRFGFDISQTMPVKHWMKIPRTIRNTPDYMICADQFYFLEVKGCKDFLRMKIKDLESYKFWNGVYGGTCLFFIYSTLKGMQRIISYHKLMALIETQKFPIKVYPDPGLKKEYYEIPINWIWKLKEHEIE